MREKMNLTYALLNPERTLFILMNNPQYGLQVKALPTTWLVDANGAIASVVPSANDKEGWKEIIDGFLKYLEENPVEKTES